MLDLKEICLEQIAGSPPWALGNAVSAGLRWDMGVCVHFYCGLGDADAIGLKISHSEPLMVQCVLYFSEFPSTYEAR